MKKILLILLVLLILPLVIGEPSYLFKQSETVDIRISCFDENASVCTSGVVCGITIVHPNSSLVVNNGTMTFNGTTYNYTLIPGQTTTVGEYSSIATCEGTTDGFSTFTYLITKSGENPSTAISLIYMGLFFLLLVLFILAIWGILSIKNIYGRFVLIGVSYLLLVAVSFTGWHLASNFLNNSPFIISMTWIIFRVLLAGILPFFIISFVWLLFEYRKLQQIKSLIEKGVPEDEAFAREMKRGKGKW